MLLRTKFYFWPRTSTPIQLKMLWRLMRLLTLSCQLRDLLSNCEEDKILKLLTLVKVKDFAPWPLQISFYQLLLRFAWCLLPSAQFSLFFPCCSLLTARCLIIFVFTFYFRHFVGYFLLAANYFIPVASYIFSLYFLLIACYSFLNN